MKNTLKTILCAALAVVLCLTACACSRNPLPSGGQEAESAAVVSPELGPTATEHEEEFGGIYIKIPIEDFNQLGFAFGDSLDIAFSNGQKLTDVPYYNGYYTAAGETLLVGYPGYPYIRAGINNGDDLWLGLGMRDGDTAAVTLHERGKYLNIQNARDISYTDIRSDYPSDEAFANFRMVTAGDIAEGVFYRAASPCDNQHRRATYVNDLIERAGVRVILDLADSEEKIAGYLAAEDFACPYFGLLHDEGGVIPLAMNMNYGSNEFREKIANGLTLLAESEGPFLVHCTEGKDRTGFVCMLLEAFAGATYDEIVADYMKTYDNYYKITKALDPDRYNTIKENVLDDMIRVVTGGEDPAGADLQARATDYLNGVGMTEGAISALRARLTEAS